SSGGNGGVRCEHVVINSWNGGFQGAIRLTNNGGSTVNGWRVNWRYTDGTTLSGSWNANISGSYTASNLGWNATINPGSSVEFGFTANGGGAASAVTGDVCNN